MTSPVAWYLFAVSNLACFGLGYVAAKLRSKG